MMTSRQNQQSAVGPWTAVTGHCRAGQIESITALNTSVSIGGVFPGDLRNQLDLCELDGHRRVNRDDGDVIACRLRPTTERL